MSHKSTDTEFIYVLLLSLLEGDSDEDVQRAVEELIRLIEGRWRPSSSRA